MAGGVTCRVGARSEAFSLIVIPSRQIPQSAKRAVIRLMNTNWLKSETERGPDRSCRFNTDSTQIQHTRDVPLVEFMYLVFTRMPGESSRRRLGSLLLYLCYVFRVLINSLVC